MSSLDSPNFYVSKNILTNECFTCFASIFSFYFEFSANTGGLLGLFMGFSVFSIIEIFYFLTIRPNKNYLSKSEKRQQTVNRLFRKFKLRSKRNAALFIKPQTEIIPDNNIFPFVG